MTEEPKWGAADEGAVLFQLQKSSASADIYGLFYDIVRVIDTTFSIRPEDARILLIAFLQGGQLRMKILEQIMYILTEQNQTPDYFKRWVPNLEKIAASKVEPS